MLRIRCLPLFLATLALSAGAGAQLTADQTSEVVTALSRAMRDRYVLKEKGEQVAKDLTDKLKAGAYDMIESGSELAAALNRDVNQICSDAHLRIRFSAEVLPARSQASEPSPEEIENQRKQQRLANGGFEEVKRLQGNVGYVRFNAFAPLEVSARPIHAAMSFVNDTDALIFDLRQNGGGDPETVQRICSYLFDKPTHINSLLMRRGDKLVQNDFKTEPVKEFHFGSRPVFLVVGKLTGSAAEEFSYNLQTQKRATLIGESTWGGANPGGVVRLTDHFSAFIPVGMAKNPVTGKNWEGTGVIPEVAADPTQAVQVAHRLAIEKLIETASGADRERLQSVLKSLGG